MKGVVVNSGAQDSTKRPCGKPFYVDWREATAHPRKGTGMDTRRIPWAARSRRVRCAPAAR